ncbi:MAG: BON domain-containing protein [Polyangiaceae bacterium]
MPNNFSLSATFTLLAALGTNACHGSPAAPNTPAPAPAAAPSELVNTEVKQAVSGELYKDKHIDPTRMKVTATNGIVELTGQVDNALSKERATQIAEAVRGVRTVSNRMVVEPLSRPDRDMQRDVQNALSYNAATAKMPIHVSVAGGVATLTGSVRSWQERQLAERIAEGVRGIRSAQNELKSNSTDKRNANAIADDVKTRLAWDALVEHDPITVAVTDNKLTLTGSAGSAAEKSRAISDARVEGVASIDATGVEVKWWDRPDPNLRVTRAKSDPDIASAIKNAARYDPRVLSFNVTPTVHNGLVTLSGTVDTLKAKRAAEALARNTVGVVDVDNQLIAWSREPLSDKLLQSRIEAELAFDALTDSKDIRVTVGSGLVTLTGSVGTYFESAEALDAASRLAGVTHVADNLQVKDQVVPYVYSAWLDPYAPFVDAWYVISPHPSGSDSMIEQRMKADFAWSPFILPQDIQIHVENGKATLTGKVQTSRERRAAAEAAIEAGAISVENRLKLG